MVIKRVTIIRQINDVIKSVCKMPDDEDDVDGEEESVISFKKIVKIMNLCQVYVPLIQ
jgi:hypothetical protein